MKGKPKLHIPYEYQLNTYLQILAAKFFWRPKSKWFLKFGK